MTELLNTNTYFLDETVRRVEVILGDELDTLTVERAVIGIFFTGVKLSNGKGGLCFTPIKEIPQAVCCPSSARAMPNSGRLTRRTVRQYLADLRGENILKKTLGIAVLNALSETCLKRITPDYVRVSRTDSFDLVPALKPGQKAVVIGALVPMLRVLLKAEADFTVLEMDKSTLKGRELDHYAPASDAAKYVPEADVLVITGVTVLNDTLPGLLKMTKPGAYILVTGPSASMLPDAFFEQGVSAVGGIQVTKPDELLDVIAEGGSGYHFFEKSAERQVFIKKQ
jgi:uncharacterized protein (DUF4213/DUF364 family)